tara:strand:- start:3199 stop:3330 length:132 start_codon:yes stop_codon:yes gene_type:complete
MLTIYREWITYQIPSLCFNRKTLSRNPCPLVWVWSGGVLGIEI